MFQNKSDLDLYDLIGSSWTSGELLKPDTYSSLRKKLDKNDNIKETYNSLSNRSSVFRWARFLFSIANVAIAQVVLTFCLEMSLLP